ncbi:MAG: glycosyltransferase [Anaerostipes sp.]|nr:glycosyltransferase [Anaerostipes sp.]
MGKIAVLMSTYNGEKYIEEQIDSILNQKCNCEIDLIIRDDGSKDNTKQIIKKYVAANKIKAYSGGNMGAGYGFISMIRDNPGYDYYAFSDQDDFWYEKKLQKGIDKIKAIDNYALYCSNAEMCDSSLNFLGRNVHKKMTLFNKERVFLGLACAQGCTCIFNKQLAEIIQKSPMPKDIVLHDSYITCLCFALGGYFFADEWPSMRYRMHGNNIGGLITKSQSNVCLMLKKRFEYIKNSPQHSIIEQNIYILNNYSKNIDNISKKLIYEIIQSKKKIRFRLKYCISKKIKDETMNLSIANLLKILFNNY